MEGFVAFLAVACLFAGLASGFKIYNVVDFGAAGDGKNDDTKHFLSAWSAACDDSTPSRVLVPGGKTFLLRQVVFSGPCRHNMHFQVIGTIVAPPNVYTITRANNNWIMFYRVDNLTMDGGGRFDGRGSSWWQCKAEKKCSNLPDGLAIMHCDYLRMYSLTITNAPAKQVTFYGSTGVFVSNLYIISPGDSPNTDGMHIQECKQALVKDSIISSGDDCIGIGTGTYGLNITRISCGPGHGISIGSLGRNRLRDTVKDVHVSYCDFYQTMHAARIKTWSGGRGLVQGIKFEHMNLSSVKSPILIDQYYCPQHNCQKHTAAVQVKDVSYVGIKGTTTGNAGIRFLCSDAIGCSGILMKKVKITSASPGKKLESVCSNAHGDSEGSILPEVPCLS